MPTLEAEDVYALAPYAKTLGVVFEEISEAGVRARLVHDLSLSTVGGGLHGGALMGLADVCAAVCAALNGPAGAAPATVEVEHALSSARTHERRGDSSSLAGGAQQRGRGRHP